MDECFEGPPEAHQVTPLGDRELGVRHVAPLKTGWRGMALSGGYGESRPWPMDERDNETRTGLGGEEAELVIGPRGE